MLKIAQWEVTKTGFEVSVLESRTCKLIHNAQLKKNKKVLCFSPTPPHLMPSLLVLTKFLEEKATGSDSTGEGI